MAKKRRSKKVKQKHPCPVCGKETTNPKYCSKKCFSYEKSVNPPQVTDKINIDNRNICRQCKRPMPMDRYSMYCEECELLIEEQ